MPHSRLVDRHTRPWALAPLSGDGPPPSVPAYIRYHSQGQERLNLPQLGDMHGPMRPVGPMRLADQAVINAALAECGDLGVTTVCAALDVAHAQLVLNYAVDRGATLAGQLASGALCAGAPGSWQSSVLMDLVWFGQTLNLAVASDGQQTVEQLRRAGPGPRVVVRSRDAVAEVLLDWVTGERQYTEVAGNLAFVVSQWADTVGGAEGWSLIADEELQPAGRESSPNFTACYRLLHSRSDHYAPGLL